MSTNVKHAISTWNKEYLTATKELETLESTLKADYNKYIDSLVAYVARIKEANEIRQGFIRVLENEDVSNDTKTLNEFAYYAKQPIKNKADKYLLDNPVNLITYTYSVTSVRACDIERLLGKKNILKY